MTLIIETSALFLLLRRRYDARTIVLNSIIANTITVPVVWFVFPFLGLGWVAETAMAELFAFVCEALYYKKAFAGIGWYDAFFVSFACNSLSFGFGLLLTWF
jgi:hypothetical protein